MHTALIRCRKGSSTDCTATALPAPGYSAGKVVRVSHGLSVSKRTDINSCPDGYKIWSPRNKNDWEIVWEALGKNAANFPKKNHVIIDVTKPNDNACSACTGAMKSSNPKQNEWRTSDGSAWWLRDTAHANPLSSYTADCYMAVQNVDPTDVRLDAAWCKISSTDYLCQPEAKCTYTL